LPQKNELIRSSYFSCVVIQEAYYKLKPIKLDCIYLDLFVHYILIIFIVVVGLDFSTRTTIILDLIARLYL